MLSTRKPAWLIPCTLLSKAISTPTEGLVAHLRTQKSYVLIVAAPQEQLAIFGVCGQRGTGQAADKHLFFSTAPSPTKSAIRKEDLVGEGAILKNKRLVSYLSGATLPNLPCCIIKSTYVRTGASRHVGATKFIQLSNKAEGQSALDEVPFLKIQSHGQRSISSFS
jgi:hypothetical protein